MNPANFPYPPPPATPCPFDEWRDGAGIRPAWQPFFQWEATETLAEKQATAQQKIRDNGVTYTIYAEANGSAHPWSLDILPFILSEADWRVIAEGVSQRADLLNRMLQDLYGRQTLLKQGLLPTDLVLGHPGYVRALSGYQPPQGVFLHLVAFDLARDPSGQWTVVAQRTQAPSGLGYALENRLIVSRLFPTAFRQMRVQHLASSYRRWLTMLAQLSPAGVGGAPPCMVLLTPGEYNETYFEHAYLARYLGIPLVEGSDLTVRGDALFLKTLTGLTPVQVVLRRLDDSFCDPLELRQDSTLGIPGLLQAVRAGKVLMANALGTGFLESPSLHAFLPALCRHLTGESLRLPSLLSWWCGETAACEEARADLNQRIIQPTYPADAAHPAFNPILTAHLSPAERAAWHAKLLAEGRDYTVQDHVPLSQTPIWRQGQFSQRPAMLRVFAMADGQGGWEVMPGGLTRVAESTGSLQVSMQRGGSSLDTWVLTTGEVDTFSLLPGRLQPADLAYKRRLITSRSAENLFWMGRYAERAEQQVRVAHWALEWLAVHDADTRSDKLTLLVSLCRYLGLLPPDAPPLPSPQALAAALRQGHAAGGQAWGIAPTLSALAAAAAPVRDRLSPTYSRLVLATQRRLNCPAADNNAAALADLAQLAVELVAISGEQADHMTRDDGWRFLGIGRHVERLGLLSAQLTLCFDHSGVPQGPTFDLLLVLFESVLTYRSYYQCQQELPALLDLLVCSPDNPRALAHSLAALQQGVKALPTLPGMTDLAQLLPPHCPSLVQLCETDAQGRLVTLRLFVQRLLRTSTQLSDALGLHYFNHNPAWRADEVVQT